jgi:hypothetical protein
MASGFDFQTFAKQNEMLLLFGGIGSILWLIAFPGFSKSGLLGSGGFPLMWILSLGLTGLGAYGLYLNSQHSTHDHSAPSPEPGVLTGGRHPHVRHRTTPTTAHAHYANSINPYYEYY